MYFIRKYSWKKGNKFKITQTYMVTIIFHIDEQYMQKWRPNNNNNKKWKQKKDKNKNDSVRSNDAKHALF